MDNGCCSATILDASARQLKPAGKPKYKFMLFAHLRPVTLERLLTSKQNVDVAFRLAQSAFKIAVTAPVKDQQLIPYL